jgi:alkylation response protein AidB-like acyl-CoA dehydrogenase
LADDPHFASLVGEFPGLRAFAEACATEVDALARNTNREEHLPRLQRYDADGRRTESVIFHPDHHRIGELVWGADLLGRYRAPGQELETLSLLYLLAQNGEGGWCCPLACTAGMIKVCQRANDLPAPWQNGLLSSSYPDMLHASQFLTEVQGGSDVGANVLSAVRADDASGWWRLSGEKWFCSVIDARLFLVTARPVGAPPGTTGLRAFVVPRAMPGLDLWDPNSAPNQYIVRRLKWKLGTRSMASAEVDFQGAYGWPVADFQQTVDTVLNTSRLYNAICASGMLQRAWREADAWARTRLAFGHPIVTFPSVARTLARLRCESWASRSLTFDLAALADRIALGTAGSTEPTAWRMLVNLNKIWTALTCPAGVRDAIEILGGNGAIEEFSVLPRLLRDSLVIEAWEGGHGVLCAQVLRDAKKGMHRSMFAYLELRIGTGSAELRDLAALWEQTLQRPDAAVVWRDLVEQSRSVVQAALLRAQGAPEAIVSHFLALHNGALNPLHDPGLEARIRQVVA